MEANVRLILRLTIDRHESGSYCQDSSCGKWDGWPITEGALGAGVQHEEDQEGDQLCDRCAGQAPVSWLGSEARPLLL